MKKIAEGCIKFQNEKLHNLHSSSVIMEIKSRMRCLRHKAGVHKPQAPGYSGD